MKVRLTLLMFLFSILYLNGQIKLGKIVNDVKKKAEQKIEQRIEQKADKAVDSALDKIEGKVDETVAGKKKEPKKPDSGTSSSDDQTGGAETQTNSHNPQTESPAANSTQQNTPVLQWNKFDFVPGTEIIFEDNQEGEQNGEFPGKWDLSGGVAENAVYGGSPVIMFRKNNINGTDGIVPLLKNRNEDYLPEEFTIEFDTYFPFYYSTYQISLLDPKNQRNIDPTNNVSKRFYLRFKQNMANGRDISDSYYPGFTNANTKSNPGWRHISISFNKRALKAYIDDARVLNIPNLSVNPLGVCIAYHNTADKDPGFIRNIRIAKGAVPLYDKLLTDGKFVTTGIRFDVNKATIRPESAGTIHYVVKMMNDNPDLKFCVEGHTDSDGDAAVNQKLSEARAKAVRELLINAGIQSDRLTSKGHGESSPVSGNDSPEGKAQNRRVEFIKTNS